MSTRERILSVALEEFAAQGFEATSMRRLAERVGVRAASLYGHFPSKQAILEELLALEGPASAIALLRSAQEGVAVGSPRSILRRFGRALASSWSAENARRFRGLHSRLAADVGPNIRYVDGVRRVLAEVATLLGRWRDEGLLHGEEPAFFLAWELMAPIGNLRTSFWNLDASEDDVAEGLRLCEAHLDYFLDRHFPVRGESPHEPADAGRKETP